MKVNAKQRSSLRPKLEQLVYAQHGHELMRYKSSVGRSPSLAIYDRY